MSGWAILAPDYDLTRHNIGFYCIDQFAHEQKFPAFKHKKELRAELSIQTINDTRVILCKPQTFMNDSGQAVAAIQGFYKIQPEDTAVVHDELDIPFGQIRLRSGGGSAGHNGLKSLIEHGNENAGRVRIGIHNAVADKADSADFVLNKFSKAEQARLPELATAVRDILIEYIASSTLPHDTRSF